MTPYFKKNKISRSYRTLPPPRTGAKAVATKPQRQSSFRSGATFPYREFSYAEFPYK